MKSPRWVRWAILAIALPLASCQPADVQLLEATATPVTPTMATAASTPTHARAAARTPTPMSRPTPVPTSPAPRPSQLSGDLVLTLPYTSIEDGAAGRIRGRLFFPSEYIPSLEVYAVAVKGGRFYRVDTPSVPPGQPDYEIPLAEPGAYYVYAYPVGDDAQFGGAYSYLAACEAGHLVPRPEDCWEDPRHDLAPVEVLAGQAVEEIDILDWYGASVPPPPTSTGDWLTYTSEQLAYRMSYPPHWEVRWERQGETAFGPSAFVVEGVPDNVLASVRVTNGDPEELADQLIASLPPADVLGREWQPFARRDGLHVVLETSRGWFEWWFVPRYELVYIVHAVTDSGLGSFDQMVETFAFVE